MDNKQVINIVLDMGANFIFVGCNDAVNWAGFNITFTE